MSAGKAAARQVELLSIAQGFVPSAVIFTLMKLGIFRILASGTSELEAIAAAAGTRVDRLARLLDAGVMLRVIEGEAGRYAIAPSVRGILSDPTAPGYQGDWLEFIESWFEPFASLDQVVKGQDVVSMYESDEASVRRTTLAMHDLAASRGRELVDFLDLSGARNLLDVGCGPGTYSFEMGKKFPSLELTLLDKPDILMVSKEVMARYSPTNPVHLIPCDLNVDSIDGSYDAVLISNVLQAFDPVSARALVSRLFDVVAPGGSLIVQAQFLDDDRQGPRWPTYVDLACMCFTEAGQNHSVGETVEWMSAAGFTAVEHNPMSLRNPNGFVRGYRR